MPNHDAPAAISLAYRNVGGTHVFSSIGLKGLIHAGGHDLQAVYKELPALVSTHMQHAYGVDGIYEALLDFPDVESALRGPALSASFLTFARA